MTAHTATPDDLQPDPAVIKQYLREITRRWGELDEPCLLEVCMLTDDDNATISTQHFEPTDEGLDEAAAHAAAMNPYHRNGYACPNPVSATNRPPAGKRASHKRGEIVAAFFHWADADTAEAPHNIRAFVGPKCTMHVLTGEVPHQRPHTYYELEVPTRNLEAWKATQKAIAATLGTDPGVVDPARLMRLAGTVSWPPPKKIARGYVKEMTKLRVYDKDVRPPIPSEIMAWAFGAAAPASNSGGAPIIDTGDEYGPALDRALAAENILNDKNWRNNVKSLVCSYVAKGWKDFEIFAICDGFTLPGYTVAQTREDVKAFIKWAREQETAKGGLYATSPDAGSTGGRDPYEHEKEDRQKRQDQDDPWGDDDPQQASGSTEAPDDTDGSRQGASTAEGPPKRDVSPVDLWGAFAPPELPTGLLPRIIEDLAFVQGAQMGVDPGGIAAAALCVCCAAIPDSIKLRVKRYEKWSESARIWVALVGGPSVRKSPIISMVERPLRDIDFRLHEDFIKRKMEYDALSKDDKAKTPRPKQVRKCLGDTTIEAAQEVMADSPDGVLVKQDELSGWFGGMDRYSGGKGGKDRGFWLESFNGGSYLVNRVGRGSSAIKNLSACVLGGIQPEPIRAIMADASDDGLIQRLTDAYLRLSATRALSVATS